MRCRFVTHQKPGSPSHSPTHPHSSSQVSRSIDELEQSSAAMDGMRQEYREMKLDYEVVLSELQRKEAAGTIDRAKQRQVQDMRSMVSVAETR